MTFPPVRALRDGRFATPRRLYWLLGILIPLLLIGLVLQPEAGSWSLFKAIVLATVLALALLSLSLRSTLKALERSLARSAQEAALFSASPNPLMILARSRDGDYLCERINPAASRLFGGGTGGVVIGELAGGELVRRALELAAPRADGMRVSALSLPAAEDRGAVQLRLILAPIDELSGQERFALICLDETAQRLAEQRMVARSRRIRALNDRLEHRVSERTAELERAYQEMESFSYSVSHDLRAPLRAIHGYAYLLRDSEAQSLTAEGRGLLDRVLAASLKMSELIDDFLDLSRVGRVELELRRVDMDGLVADIVAELAGEYPAVSIEVEPLPAAEADPRLLRSVWRNLIVNALKFSAQKGDARVRIGFREEGDHGWFFVSDNGIGFDMAYADKLFGAFQRLHPSRNIEGTGIGLAIVKRVVERHHGEVRAIGEPDRGATFSFRLA
ncbi:sensor histidine kinase [Niveibacterium terrae]|uniref:sensor histidine kinase n=1 Tax=Niveibacterium terrae TaxID=3373598 RepID=UPI003A8D376B